MMHPTEFRFRMINTALTAILVVGVFLAWSTFRSDHDQRRRVYTMHLYDEWRTLLDLSDTRITLELVRSETLKSADLLRQVGEYCLEVGQRKMSYEEVLERRQHIISVLNLFEQVVVAHRDNVGDQQMIENYFKDAIIDHYTNLAPFIRAWEDPMKRRRAWVPVTTAVEEWTAPTTGRPAT